MSAHDVVRAVVTEICSRMPCEYPECRERPTGFYEGRQQFGDSGIPEDFFYPPRLLCEAHSEACKSSADSAEYSNWCCVCGCYQPVN
jgi:hypothetical protein